MWSFDPYTFYVPQTTIAAKREPFEIVSLCAKIIRDPASKRVLRPLLCADFSEELLTHDVDALRALPVWKQQLSARARLRSIKKPTLAERAEASKTQFDTHYFTAWDLPENVTSSSTSSSSDSDTEESLPPRKRKRKRKRDEGDEISE